MFESLFFGNGQRGVYLQLSRPKGGIGKTRPWEALQRAPTCLKFNYDALVRCPQPMSSTHIISFISGYVVGSNGSPVQEGSYGSLPLTMVHVGGVCPRISTIFMQYPLVTSISPHLTANIPNPNPTSLHHYITTRGSRKTTYKRHLHVTVGLTVRKDQGLNCE